MSESKTELNDYSGPYKHDLVFEDLSKEFLIKLMLQWRVRGNPEEGWP